MTIRFLLRYLSRPLHFFGTLGMLGIGAGGALAVGLAVDKFLHNTHAMQEHGPLLIFAAVLILAGVQLLALGLLGELQVRHYYDPAERLPYSIDRVLRTDKKQSAVSDEMNQ